MVIATPAKSPNSLPCQISTPYKMRVFCKPVYEVRARGCPPSPNHDPFTTKSSTHHVHTTLRVTSPTSPCPTLTADAEPTHKHVATIFSAQCAVWYNQTCTIVHFSFISKFIRCFVHGCSMQHFTQVILLYYYRKSHTNIFWMKTSACRDGTLKNQPN